MVSGAATDRPPETGNRRASHYNTSVNTVKQEPENGLDWCLSYTIIRKKDASGPMRLPTKIGCSMILTISVGLFLVASAPGFAESDEDFIEGPRRGPGILPVTRLGKTSKYPIVIPSTAELREILKNRKPVQRDAARDNRKNGVVKGTPLGDLSAVQAVGRKRCNRAIPTRAEFLRMLRDRPADARQIMERCKIDVSSISPIRQLPVQVRQLPEDTRQRPVGTWTR